MAGLVTSKVLGSNAIYFYALYLIVSALIRDHFINNCLHIDNSSVIVHLTPCKADAAIHSFMLMLICQWLLEACYLFLGLFSICGLCKLLGSKVWVYYCDVKLLRQECTMAIRLVSCLMHQYVRTQMSVSSFIGDWGSLSTLFWSPVRWYNGCDAWKCFVLQVNLRHW